MLSVSYWILYMSLLFHWHTNVLLVFMHRFFSQTTSQIPMATKWAPGAPRFPQILSTLKGLMSWAHIWAWNHFSEMSSKCLHTDGHWTQDKSSDPFRSSQTVFMQPWFVWFLPPMKHESRTSLPKVTDLKVSNIGWLSCAPLLGEKYHWGWGWCWWWWCLNVLLLIVKKL